MSTLYEMFKVSENATDEEIKQAYEKIIEKSESLPQTEKLIEQARRVKIAYGILSNPEKRKKYDLDLATKRADELLQNVKVREEKIEESYEKEPQIQISEIDEEKIKNAIDQQIDKIQFVPNEQNLKQTLEKKRKQKQEIEKGWENSKFSQSDEQLLKQIKKQQKREKRQAKKDEQLKREMEINAYGKFLEDQGYKVKYPWTWLRVKRLLISIAAVVITCFIMWQIPFVRQKLTDLYNENFLVRTLVNIVISIFSSIGMGIKGIFK